MTSPLAENEVYQMDALDLLRALPDASVDCVLTDPPYGTTACAWDTPIDLVAWWAAVRRVVKPRAAIVMTASQPFTSALVMSNAAMFRHEWVWEKSQSTGFLNVNIAPLKAHESVLVFGVRSVAYYAQLERGDPYTATTGSKPRDTIRDKKIGGVERVNAAGIRQPRTVIRVDVQTGLHPTQKPVALFEYLIRTYSRPGDLVVDPFGGSGTTAVAARNLGRRYITGDTDAGYCAIMRRRLSEPYTPQMFAEEADAADDAPRQVEMFEEA